MLHDENTIPNEIDSLNESTQPVHLNPSVEQTVAIPAPPPPTKGNKTLKAQKPKKPGRWRWILLGLLIFLGLAGGGMYLGYQEGIRQRLAKQNEGMAVDLVTQYELGVKDMEAGRLEVARKRFETVIQYDPSYPGAMEHLTQVMLSIAKTTAPTAVFTPTVSPTPDMRGIEEKYNTAYQLVRAQDWDNAITALESVRKENTEYHAVEVDGMFAIALRERGILKIKSGGLEQGMYDLSLAERFAPLDKDAEGYRTWARMYVIGVSFWELDWAQVVDYFSQIYGALPYLSDGNYTAADRYRLALWSYGDQFVANGDYCSARDQYKLSLAINNDAQLVPTATEVGNICEPPTEVPKAKKATKTPVPETAEEGIVTETPTP